MLCFIDYRGKWLGTLSIITDQAGYQELLSWAQSFDQLRRAGVEGTGTYGAGIAQFLHTHGVEVWEINRPDRCQRRFQGKFDPTDAESAACTVLSGKAQAIPKLQKRVAEAMRTLSVARRAVR